MLATVESFQVQVFLSTPSARRATLGGCDGVYYHAISIHALREEGDSGFPDIEPMDTEISIHALREEGDLRGDQADRGLAISIHALREEGDILTPRSKALHNNFYPRPPRGGRPTSTRARSSSSRFLSTPSARRATPDAEE